MNQVTHQAQRGKCVKRRRKSPKNRRGRRSEFWDVIGLVVFNRFEDFISLGPFINSIEALIDSQEALTHSNPFVHRSESAEEGELESDNEMLNPMVSVTKIDPSEIPEVSNRFLMRAQPREDPERRSSRDRSSRDRDYDRDDRGRERNFGWSKKSVPVSRSGRTIKGRGNFRYRTPSRSRSRSVTPEHWKAAQRNVIKLTDFERLGEQKKAREAEITRREDERKKRHAAMSQGDGKKSFFELAQEVPEPTVITVASSLTRPQKSGSVDLNALDYEESDSDKDSHENFKRNDGKNGKSGSELRSRRNTSHSRSKSPIKRRSSSRDRFDRDRRNFQPVNRNRFDNNRWGNNRAVGRNRFDNNRWRSPRDRRSRTRSRSSSR